LIPPCALTYLIAAWMPAHPSPLDPWVENSLRNARLIGVPWAVEVPAAAFAAAVDPLAVGLPDPAEFDEHAVSASAAAASPQIPPQRAPRFMGSPVVGRCQTTLVDSSLLVPPVAADTQKVTAVTGLVPGTLMQLSYSVKDYSIASAHLARRGFC
jgi:hypothetical protein